ncbi:uncharacterized protein LOC130713040 [Lotus japonicus]|uniref:uncharacterized protein LOC130713040 n=1 Tax=Lotus japonicus TaxID=34305 RepID=UPI00258F8908|nr:uncharacterized protein LOC130713040 [Lotus japonicus]
MDVLSNTLNRGLQTGLLNGFHMSPTCPKLTHLFFADDAILFAKASEAELYQLHKILNTFSKASGQRINIQKSGLMGGKHLLRSRKVTLANILGIQVWDKPEMYLGMPVEWGRSKAKSLQWIKEKILNKIQGWSGNLLNQAGKEVLIKSVLQAIPSFAMSILKFPKSFCSQICSKIAQFWWRGKKQRGIHWKKWEILTYRKEEGGKEEKVKFLGLDDSSSWQRFDPQTWAMKCW